MWYVEAKAEAMYTILTEVDTHAHPFLIYCNWCLHGSILYVKISYVQVHFLPALVNMQEAANRPVQCKQFDSSLAISKEREREFNWRAVQLVNNDVSIELEIMEKHLTEGVL